MSDNCEKRDACDLDQQEIACEHHKGWDWLIRHCSTP